jgi:hypothetical protein
MSEEFLKRMLGLFSYCTDKETRGFLWVLRRYYRGFTRNFADALGVNHDGLTESQTLKAVQDHLEILRRMEEDEDKFECTGCGEIADAEGLRWEKLGRGEPVTVSIDHSGKPDWMDWLTDEHIMEHWAGPWERANPIVKFKLLGPDEGKGDCHITWAHVDGPGGTLKFVWVPARGATFMEEGGDLSGDMVCDNSETHRSRVVVDEGGCHEFGHVIGIGHLLSPSDKMYAYAVAVRRSLSLNDIREEDKRYPYESTTN